MITTVSVITISCSLTISRGRSEYGYNARGYFIFMG